MKQLTVWILNDFEDVILRDVTLCTCVGDYYNFIGNCYLQSSG